MGVLDWMGKKIFGKQAQNMRSAMEMPLYVSSFGNNVYESDIVLACLHAIAEETSKMVIKSVKKSSDGTVSYNNDDISRLFELGPNPLMTTKDLLYWSSWRLETRANVFLFPEVNIITYADGRKVEQVSAIYPIDSVQEEMYIDKATGEYTVRFVLSTGSVYTVPYKYVIHLRKYYSDDFFFGKISRKDLLKTLQTSKLVTDLMPKAIQASMQVKGVITAKSLSEVEGLKKFKNEFEQTLDSGKTSIAVMDVAGELKPVSISPQIVDAAVLKHLEDNILKVFGVPLGVIMGDANEATWSSFYQKNIEPFKIAFEQASSRILFTERELSFGNRIKCYDKLVQHYTITTRLNIIKELGGRNYLSRAEQRELAGYEPDGGPEKVSLNFVDQDKANEYQGVKKTPEETKKEEDPNVGED